MSAGTAYRMAGIGLQRLVTHRDGPAGTLEAHGTRHVKRVLSSTLQMDNRFDHPVAGFCADEAGRLLFYDA